ncbi:DUF421 domain-containing protein [Jiella marina]|uniref:DUF421 domain-containing protein n=1 Tax=Jiella sp. LLJ827 TaxID=2917712 RepID=UPI0021008404|nr:YetF domain-containing protein [Jiella sp. LLJ827]MCQ0989194.1 DUF421 domain-containing protein [Jiella sp. LLJ827]
MTGVFVGQGQSSSWRRTHTPDGKDTAIFGLPDIADSLIAGLLLGGLALAVIIALVRTIGLRSFSKMTAFDFVITLATGSLLATASSASNWASFLQAVVAILALMTIQVVLAFARRRSRLVTGLVDNQPLLLMRDGVFIDEAMATSRVSPGDVYAKLRGANIQSMSEVRAVVLETTGDISVLHGETVAPELLRHVRGADVGSPPGDLAGHSASEKA